MSIQQSHYYRLGDKLTFNLMVRSRGNVIVRDKAASESGVPVKLCTGRFPKQSENEYRQTRMMVSESAQMRREMSEELGELEKEKRMLISS